MNNGIPTSPPQLLLVDDEPAILYSYEMLLRRAGYDQIRTVGDSREILPLLDTIPVALVLLDLGMPHLSGRDLLHEIATRHPVVPVIIVTGSSEIDTAVSCMKSGACDYLTKPVDPDRFVASVRKALKMNAMHREITSLRDYLLTGKLHNEDAFAAFTTRNPRMRTIFGYIQGVSVTGEPVLVTGETGTGKELAARAIHAASNRTGAFVAVNAAGLDDLMFADTLFGHRKGAFTGADRDREGMIAAATGGTLFLDEIGELSPTSQIKLLRLLQEGEYYPLGTDRVVLSKARIVVATNRDLRSLATDSSFRRDLYYRLATHTVHLPPLRERRDDLPLLLEHFLGEAATSLGKPLPAYPGELLDLLSAYDFPGNVRELRAMVFNAMAQHRGKILSLTPFIAAAGTEPPATINCRPAMTPNGMEWPPAADRFPTLKAMEEFLVAEALKVSAGNQGPAARLLGISRQALNKRVRKK
jgi:DNA-binding NtrC family response regulator